MRIKIILLLISFLLFSHSSLSGYPQSNVYVIPIRGVIDLGLSSFVRRVVEEAKEKNLSASSWNWRLSAAE